MPVLSIPPKVCLRDWKLYCLEQIAYLDVSAVLPTQPPEMLQTREELLEALSDIEARFDALGADAEERDVTWMAEAFWDARPRQWRQE